MAAISERSSTETIVSSSSSRTGCPSSGSVWQEATRRETIGKSFPVNLAPMPDGDDKHSKDPVGNLVNDPVVAAPDSIEIFITGKLDDARWAGVRCE
jgi:hypothetical protein